MTTPRYTSPDAARASNTATSFAPVSSPAYSAPVNPWSSLENPGVQNYIKFVQTQDPVLKNKYFASIMGNWASTPSPTGKGSMSTYVQELLRSTGYSKGKVPVGTYDSADTTGLDKALQDAIKNGSDPLAWLQTVSQLGGIGGTGKKQPDTTPKYNKQISTALQMKDFSDAKQTLNDAYFQAYGMYPTKDTIEKFGNAFNAELQRQTKSTTTTTKTTYKPVVDPKTGKQLRDAEGILQYEATNDTKSMTPGQGFTQDEQSQFLATYLADQFPDLGTPEQIGGAAKTIYDDIAATYKNNYQTAPDMKTIAPILQQVIGSADANTAKAILDKKKAEIREVAATKYMGIADYVRAGEDANKYIEPLINTASQFFETPITADDSFLKMALNYQAPDKTYRLMNDYEIQKAMQADPRYGKTAKAKNEAINVAQALMDRLK